MNSTWIQREHIEFLHNLFTIALLRSLSDELLLTPYVHQARWISQSIHPFISIQRVFYAGFPESRNKVADGLVDTYVGPVIHRESYSQSFTATRRRKSVFSMRS